MRFAHYFDLELDAEERRELGHLADITTTLLSFVFIALLIIQYGFELSGEAARWLSFAQWLIWAVFTVEFCVRFVRADAKLGFLRSHWVMALAVALPALRVLRVAQALQAVQSFGIARLLAIAQRAVRRLRRIARFGGIAYAAGLTLIVWLLSAAGMTYLERQHVQANIRSFGDALWWAAGTITTIGSDKVPTTGTGRVLAVMLMVYALAIAGYITATLAVAILGLRQADPTEDIKALQDEIRALRLDLAASGRAGGPASAQGANEGPLPVERRPDAQTPVSGGAQGSIGATFRSGRPGG